MLEGRLDKREMEQLIREGRYALVIDATHPYAAVVTQNIKEACQDAGAEYIRLLREEGDFCRESVRMAGSIEEAVAVLNEDDDRVSSDYRGKRACTVQRSPEYWRAGCCKGSAQRRIHCRVSVGGVYRLNISSACRDLFRGR